jgi:hypothetical protein
MSADFLEDAPDKIYAKRQNIFYEWNDGRKLVMPIDQARIAGVRLQRALAEHDTKTAKVIRMPRKRPNGHAASP